MKPRLLYKNFTSHAKQVMLQLHIDVATGCPLSLAVAHAMVSYNNLALALTPAKFRIPEEHDKIRICQALQIAIEFYERPETISAVGADQAAAMVTDFLFLLRDENFN